MENEIEKVAFESKQPDRGYTVKASYLKDTDDALVEIFKNGEPLRSFLFPAYKIWNIAAHFHDIADGKLETKDYEKGGVGMDLKACSCLEKPSTEWGLPPIFSAEVPEATPQVGPSVAMYGPAMTADIFVLATPDAEYLANSEIVKLTRDISEALVFYSHRSFWATNYSAIIGSRTFAAKSVEVDGDYRAVKLLEDL